MADVSKDLLDEIKRLEDMFVVPAQKLKAITSHFVSELTRGEFRTGRSIEPDLDALNRPECRGWYHCKMP